MNDITSVSEIDSINTMEYDYDSFRDYYLGDDYPVKNIYLICAICLMLGFFGLFDTDGFLYPYGSIVYLILGGIQLFFPRWGITWGKKRDFLTLQDGLLKWSFKKDKQELRLNEIKAVKKLVSGLQIYKEDGASLFLPTHMIKSKVKFTEFNDLVLPHLEKNHE